MDRSPRRQSSGDGDRDRLSQLDDHVLGHILSFLPAKEAARAALLSPRWRNIFAGVHTVVLEQPESPIREPRDHYSPGCSPPPDPNQPPPFFVTISAALLGRNRRSGGVPLRGLHLATEGYCHTSSSTMDQWVSFALQQAAPEGIDLDLRLRCQQSLCADRPYSLRRAGQGHRDQSPASVSDDMDTVDGNVSDEVEVEVEVESRDELQSPPQRATASADDAGFLDTDSDNDSSVLSDDDNRNKREQPRYSWLEYRNYTYTVTKVIYSCAQLRSLSLGSCKLAPPTHVSMPLLEALLLSHVSDPGSEVEHLISGCPRLTNLTIEACDAVTSLSVLSGVRLRRLALRCCHNLATVAVDSSQLQAFEYRGSVPDNNFITLHGGTGRLAYCKVDICGEEVSSENDLIKLRQLLQQFANAQHLHLESARLGSGLDNDVPMRFPSLPSLLNLELRGRLPDDDTSGVAAVSRILEHSPNLRTLSLVFHPEEHYRWSNQRCYYSVKEGDLLDAHHLSYNQHSTLAVPCALIPCLRSQVREINLVHYQGGKAQRTLAQFLLSNAPVMEELCCEIAEGPLRTQTQLMCEIKGWVVNKSADIHIS